ncbi:MAG TPA: lipocalin family protein [Thermomonas sp.]|nr:lipocalin family protein [Thermomonas sp.]
MVRLALATLAVAAVAACATSKPTMPAVPQVDLPRFMGDWYVIAHIPSFPEREAYNAIESYRLDDEGKIRTTFQFRKGSFDAPLDTMEPVGTVEPGTGNAVWGMQFVWPIQAEYIIADLDPEYRWTLIGRSKRDYLWIMARTPTLPAAEYDALVAKAQALGYDTSKLRKVPQQWPETGPDPRTR